MSFTDNFGNPKGSHGLLIPVSPGSVPVMDEKSRRKNNQTGS